jgi:hypothetical protein
MKNERQIISTIMHLNGILQEETDPEVGKGFAFLLMALCWVADTDPGKDKPIIANLFTQLDGFAGLDDTQHRKHFKKARKSILSAVNSVSDPLPDNQPTG